jgi:hypothetical protein
MTQTDLRKGIFSRREQSRCKHYTYTPSSSPYIAHHPNPTPPHCYAPYAASWAAFS